MELDMVLLALGASVLGLLLALTRARLKSWALASNPNLNLPPGPWTLPVIGSAHHLLTGRSIYRAMGMLAEKHGPLMQIWLGEVPAVVATSPEAAQAILKTHDLAFADRYRNTTLSNAVFEGRDVITGDYGERWRQLRKICVLDLLSSSRVRSLHRIREEEVARAMQDVAASAAAGAAVNLSDRISKLVNDTMVRESIGSRCRHRDEYLRALQVLIAQMTLLNLADLFPSSKLMQMVSTAPRRALACRNKMERIFEQIIEERKESIAAGAVTDNESLLDVMLALQREGGTQIPITNETITILMFDMFGAGSETSSTTLTWTMAELLRTPRVMAKAQAELQEALEGKTTITEEDIASMSYLKMVLKEGLRLHSPVPLLVPRQCRETSQVMGYDIPKGTSIYINVWAICRDPRYWDDPEEFIPERFENGGRDFKGSDFEYLPFGYGRRACAGTNLGMANMELALASLIYHFDWTLPDGMMPKDLDMSEAPTIVASKNTPLYACPIVRVVSASA